MLSLRQIFYMDEEVIPYADSTARKKEQVTRLFNQISLKYDGLNRLISLGMDKKWRKRVVSIVCKHGARTVLDAATGTGDLAIMLAKTEVKEVVGIDISSKMLNIGRKKILRKKLSDKVQLLLADSERMPFSSNSFDAITVAFGVRNFENLPRGLSELYRVLKPGGLLVVLETSIPQKRPYKQLHRFYCNTVVPFMGELFSSDRNAYLYLIKSAAVFPYGENFNNILQETGFIEVSHHPQAFGATTIYTASKP
jgi:demethylmenaquinone methyltransferase/2-methoxy-6-polyprenyl-1,4-benzoquinol methylase